jgi:hypothetical protein
MFVRRYTRSWNPLEEIANHIQAGSQRPAKLKVVRKPSPELPPAA